MTYARLKELVARVGQLRVGIITGAELRAMCSDEEFAVVVVMAAAVGAALVEKFQEAGGV